MNLIKQTKILLTLIIFSSLLFGKQYGTSSKNLHEEKIAFNGYKRSYYLHIPSGKIPTDGYPLVIFIHGFGGNGENGPEQGNWIAKSKQEHFIVAGLNGVLKYPGRRESFSFNQRSWNCGGENTPSEVKEINDIGFIDTVITIIESHYKVNKAMIYISGFSNGAAMTFRAGMEPSEKIAAIAPVSSVLLVKSHPLKNPVSLILIYGTEDPINPFNGVKVSRFGEETERISAQSMWEEWVKLLYCSNKVKMTYDKNGVKALEMLNSTNKSAADFYTVHGMEHSWPGGINRLPERLVGKKSN
jgi:polyhydroxybutyrate depolymerase